MYFDIEKQLLIKIKKIHLFMGFYVMKVLKYYNVVSPLVFVRFSDEYNTIKEELLLLKVLGTMSKGSDKINEFIILKIAKLCGRRSQVFEFFTLRLNNVGERITIVQYW